MKSIKATVTSKNQLTLPAELVRKYKIGKNRVVTIIDKNGVIEVRPQPSLEERMQKYWDEFHASHPCLSQLADKELHAEVRETYKHYFQEQPPQ